MDSPHNKRYIQSLEIVREDGAGLTQDNLKEVGARISILFHRSLDFFMTEMTEFIYDASKDSNPHCENLKKYKTLYDTWGEKEPIMGQEAENLLQIAVYYFLRVPVDIGTEGSFALSPVKPLGAEEEYNYFQGEEAGKYLSFLHRWSADLNTKCEKFFQYLTWVLVQPLHAFFLEGVNVERADALRRLRLVHHSLSIGKLGPWIQPLSQNTTIYEFFMQLGQLAYYVNETNIWCKEVEAAAGRTKYYGFYNGEFARECIQMFYSFLMTFMSPTRFAWLVALAKARAKADRAKADRAKAAAKFARTGEEEEEGDAEWASYMARSRPHGPRLALEDEKERKAAEPKKPRMARYRPPAPIEDKKKRKAEPKKPRMARFEAPGLALEDAPPGVASRKRGRSNDDEASSKGGEVGKASSRRGGRRHHARHSSSTRGQHHARSSSKCSIM